jgi:hypothetical protein
MCVVCIECVEGRASNASSDKCLLAAVRRIVGQTVDEESRSSLKIPGHSGGHKAGLLHHHVSAMGFSLESKKLRVSG